MKSSREEFDQYAIGANELWAWKIGIENDFESGKKVNKTKYQKICRLYEERLEKTKNIQPLGIAFPPPLPPPKR